jgi:ribosomal protein S18 acetylase RimI-like enzyme
MEITEIKYEVKKAGENEIFEHLKACDKNFIPALSNRVDLGSYSKKLFEKAVTFEAWEKKNLVGLLAIYLNDEENEIAYITNVSLLVQYSGKGIAMELMRHCIEFSRGNKFKKIILEVNKKNKDAIRLYEKFNFEVYDTKDEHLLMQLKF